MLTASINAFNWKDLGKLREITKDSKSRMRMIMIGKSEGEEDYVVAYFKVTLSVTPRKLIDSVII
jgi:hypothetical protein